MTQAASVPKDAWDIPCDGSTHDDPLLGSLQIVTRILRSQRSADSLTAGLPLVNNQLTPELLVRAARRASLSARIVKRPLTGISNLVTPAILLLNNGRACVLDRILENGRARLVMPESREGVTEQPVENLAEEYCGYAIFLQPSYQFDERTRDTVIKRPQHWLWDTLSEAWPIYGEVLLASLLVNLFALASPLFIMNVYDRVVPNHAVETLWVLAIGISIVFAFDLLMKTLRGYFLDVAGKRADIILSAALFERVLGTRLASRPASVGAFANNLHEFDSFREFFTSATLTALIDLPFLLLFIVVIWLIGGSLAWVPLTVLPLSLLAGYIVQRSLAGKVQELMRHGSHKQATLVETLTGLETVKSLSAESPMQRRWEQTVGHIAGLGQKTRFLSSSAINITVFLQQMATVAVVIYGVYLISDGELSLGGLIACTILTGRALAPLAQVAATLSRYHQARASFQSINTLMALPLEQSPDRNFLDRPVIEGGIQFSKVSFSYPGQPVTALDDVSFRLEAGERVAIIGRIGSGKSTIEKLILGLYEPDDGAILVDGTDSRQLNPADLRRHIGYVPQDATLFYGTVKENIMLGMPYADDRAVLRAADIAGVTEFANQHPMGFDLPVGERGEGLSGGQRQSIVVARALLRDPPVMVMDEPSNAMDNTTEAQFKSKFSQWLGGKTLVLVTHRASLLTLVDRIIVMDGGRILADGPKDQVLEALKQGQIRVPR
ncbi:MAG: type I secretion system permease/ATPase [Gammaproteobacteria bacterium]|nr:MAG: type I secretion system permease/ATPase [Gammaproteobacteria bacterium]